MNVKLLRKVQSHILAEPKSLNMDCWLDRQPKEHGGPSCGTIGCIAGWTVVLAEGHIEAWKLHDYAALPSRARELLGLSDRQAARLFLPDHWPPGIATRRRKARTAGVVAKVVVERIELFIRSRGAK